MARRPRHPILTELSANNRSLGRLDMARSPRHPILRNAAQTTAFLSMNGEALYLNFSVKYQTFDEYTIVNFLDPKD